MPDDTWPAGGLDFDDQVATTVLVPGHAFAAHATVQAVNLTFGEPLVEVTVTT